MVKDLEGIEPDGDDGFDAENDLTARRLCQIACNGEVVRYTRNGWDSPEDNEMWRWNGAAWEWDDDIGDSNDQHISTLTCTRGGGGGGGEVVQEQCVSDQRIAQRQAQGCSLISCGPRCWGSRRN
jgi:hypothetical protein